MKNRLSVYAFLLSFSLLGSFSTAFAGALDELSPENQEKVKNEQLVAIFEDIPGESWPKTSFYEYIKVMPDEAAAIFFDYNNHCNAMPDCISVSTKGVDPVTADVTYKVKLPWPFNSETYTVTDILSSYDRGSSYKIAWTLKEETPNTKRSVGNVRFEPLGGGTLMVHQNLITPNRVGAGLFVGQAKEKAKAVAIALKKSMEKEKIEKPELLETQLKALKTALGE